MQKKKLLLVTGLSGAGKHHVLYQLEDFGYFCVDNLPAPLLTQGIALLKKSNGATASLAVGVDVRSQIFMEDLQQALQTLRTGKTSFGIIFLEAAENELIRRFAETRRPHPLRGKKTFHDRIRSERRQLAWLRESADLIIDTTRLTPPELRRQLAAWLNRGQRKMHVTVSSFGYKFGLPQDADFIFDVRFLPNPFYVTALKKSTGMQRKVQNYVMQQPEAGKTLESIAGMLKRLIPHYVREGKATLHFAFGCTGGQHRSVVMANALKKRLAGDTLVYHRELGRKCGETHGT
ncbi:RNase adapter RapZ [bacterium]|nr:RNase adapter RapZ [bacterium]